MTLKVPHEVKLLEGLGWVKSQLSPTQEIPYLGFIVDSRAMNFVYPRKRKLIWGLQGVLMKGAVSAKN